MSPYRVVEAFDHHSVEVEDAKDVTTPRVVAIDESAFKRRFQFHTVISDPERGIVLDLVEGRHKGAVFTGLMALSDEARAPWQADQLDAVRVIGNFAAHPMKSTQSGEVMPVEPGEAEWNLEVLESLFDFFFVKPKAAAAMKAQLNKKLQEAGKPPLK